MPDPEKKDDFTPPETEDKVTPPEGYTEEEWSGLSETEREGILDGINDPDGTGDDIDDDTLEDIAGGKKPDEKKAEPDDKEKTGDGEKPPDSELPPEGDDKEKPPAEETLNDDELLNYSVKVTDADLPEDIKNAPDDLISERNQKLSELTAERKQKLADIEEKYVNNDLTDTEYETQKSDVMDEYQDKRDEIRDEYTEKIFSFKQSKRQEAIDLITWNKQQQAFFNARTDYLGEKQDDGTYKRTEKSDILFGALNQAITRIEADRPGLSGMRLLIEADKVVKRVMGVTQKAAEPAKTEKKPGTKIPDVTNLGELPSSSQNDAGSGWEALDKLTGAAYEAALERMSPEQRAAYENSR